METADEGCCVCEEAKGKQGKKPPKLCTSFVSNSQSMVIFECTSFLIICFLNKDYFLICGLYIKCQVQGLNAQWTFTDIWDLFSMLYFSPIVPGAAYRW